MKKILSICCCLFTLSTAFLLADDPSTSPPNTPPAPPAATHFVGWTSAYQIIGGVSAIEYCAFLRTKAAHESYELHSDYWDDVFMSTETVKLSRDCCITRTGGNGDYNYSVPVGRENYVIQGVTSQVAFNQFNQWEKNPKAIEIRDYINNKIAEQVSNQAIYADNAYSIRGSYTQVSYSFDALDTIVNTLLNTNTPVAFDTNGHVGFCLSDLAAGENLIYFDTNVAAEGLELTGDFNLFPIGQMKVCAHLCDEDLYSPYYRPDAVNQTTLVPAN